MLIKKLLICVLFLILIPTWALSSANGSIYFPPLSDNTWETLSTDSLGWDQQHIDSLLQFLEEHNSNAFILLKNGKIVIEEYFGDFQQNDPWYWASAGKTITAFLIGLAREQELLSIDDTVSAWLGENWTHCPPEKEEMITIRHQLAMTTGLDDAVDDANCTLDSCLVYLADAGERWAYHNAPYTLLADVLEAASNQTLNQFAAQNLHIHTGISGLFFESGYNNVFFSHARSMARFGLLMLAGGQWDGTPVLADSVYFQQMISSSQDMNEAYGYLWWLNGKSSFMLPSSQYVFTGYLCPDAPYDMYAAYGLNGQIINVVPGQNLVWIRMGNAPTSGQISPVFNNSVWIYLNEIMEQPNNDNGFAGGSGTAEDPWLIADAEQLDMIRQYLGTTHADKHFKQIDQIDLDQPPYNQGQGWEPIGTTVNEFHGHYDGDGHVISGLTINRPATNNVGLWAFVGENGMVTNLGLQDAQVVGGNYVVGTMVAFNRGTLTEVYATGSVSGGYRVGGLVGENSPGTVSYAHADVEVTANDGRIGGLVGFNVNGTVTDSYATGNVTAGWYVGGLVGRNLNGSIQRSYATGNITGSNSVGGLVGDTEGGNIANSYATGPATGGGAVGGMIGYLWQTNVSNTYSTGSVSGTSWGIGGLIGYRFGGQVSSSYWNTETSGQNSSDGGTGKTTLEMVLQETFAGWNFQQTWDIIAEASYPFLAWQQEAGSHNYPFQYTLTLNAAPETGGTPQADPDLESYVVGSEIIIDAGTNEGYLFLNWTNDEGEEISQEENFIFYMPANDVQLIAHYLELTPTFTLSFNVMDHHGNALPQAVITLNDVEHQPGVHVFDDLEPGFYTYLVMANDFFASDGEVEISDHDKEVTVVMDPDDTSLTDGAATILNVYPNPASEMVYIDFWSIADQTIYLKHTDGSTIIQAQSACIGRCTFSIPLHGLPAGQYLIVVQTPVASEKRTIMVIR